MNTSKDMAKIAVAALEDKKGEDIRVIQVGEVTVIADYFIISNGTNASQVQALVDHVEESMEKQGYLPKRIEGNRNASWVLMDYGDIIVHIFSKEDRLFYDLERVWRDGKIIDQKELLEE